MKSKNVLYETPSFQDAINFKREDGTKDGLMVDSFITGSRSDRHNNMIEIRTYQVYEIIDI